MNRYTVSSLIGEGSFGRVYKAARKEDGFIVAVKIISKRGRSNKELKNLRRECDIQAQLKHPNVIEMFESFETKNDLVVVTEFAAIDLHRYLARNGALQEQRAQLLICHLVSALYYLHSNRILHRDLKPQNVLLNEDLHAKLCDFGLARNMTMGTHVLTSIKGTPLYMAPELLAEQPYDHQADLWSLGCIAYETMAGQPPFCTTSILHLVKLIKHEEVKWPSFLSSNCRSFLQGLLEKDPSLRITWAQILCHPFVEDKLLIAGIKADNSPFINPKPKKRVKCEASKEKNYITEVKEKLASLQLDDNLQDTIDNLMSSRDSINAIPPSDIENLETDGEENIGRIVVPFEECCYKLPTQAHLEDVADHCGAATGTCGVNGNDNVILNRMEDNLTTAALEETVSTETKMNANSNLKKSSTPDLISQTPSRYRDLEKRKLSQNLENFSLRLGERQRKTSEMPAQKKERENEPEKESDTRAINMKSSGQSVEEKHCSDNSPPSLLPGWDSCDESQSPPIENEEWLAFLNRSMQEVLDGELDSLKQHNLVSIIVAPLRNSKATPKVVGSVAQLLSLPLVLGGPALFMESITTVYTEVKLVPNLMYASKLLMCSNKTASDSSVSLHHGCRPLRALSELSAEEVATISRLYELICHLVHLKEQFLSQFCDAVAILAADELLISFLNHDLKSSFALRISNCVLALLCCVVRELPENADVVEKIVFSPKLSLAQLLCSHDNLLRTRMCMLFRLLGRFSLRALQTAWNADIREAIEALADDDDESVKEEAEGTLDELRHFSFYA